MNSLSGKIVGEHLVVTASRVIMVKDRRTLKNVTIRKLPIGNPIRLAALQSAERSFFITDGNRVIVCKIEKKVGIGAFLMVC